MEKKIRELARIILDIPSNSTVAIFTHVGVDGDCLGSSLALKIAFDKLGHRALVVTDNAVPGKFFFIPQINSVVVYNNAIEINGFLKENYDSRNIWLGILIDCSISQRVGECSPLYEQCEEKMVFDHHFTSTCDEENCFINPSACAAGEIIYNLISCLEKESERKLFDYDIAQCIMTAIIADTGGFRYSNTNTAAFGIAKDLFSSYKVNLREISYEIFEKSSISRMRLLGKAYSIAKFHYNNKILICPITQLMIEECNSLESDVDGICSDLKTVEGVIVAFVLRERENGEIRVNIRCSEAFDASRFAADFGGGGHMRAAGFTLNNITLNEAHNLIVNKSSKILSGAEGN